MILRFVSRACRECLRTYSCISYTSYTSSYGAMYHHALKHMGDKGSMRWERSDILAKQAIRALCL